MNLLRFTAKRWEREFQCSRYSLQDDAHSGRPSTSITQENIETVHQLDFLYHGLDETTGISHGSKESALHDHLHMSKECARWMSRISRNEGKKVTNSYALFTRYNHGEEIEDMIHIDYNMAQQK